jgi:HAD superfamily hydrolase (TIGR01509 family)
MAIRAIVFDLFDTLVDLGMENLPRGEYAGRPLPGTVQDLYAEVRRRSGISYPQFAQAMVDVDGEFLSSRYARGLELPTGERFTALVERLELDEPELPDALTEIHMGRLREQVSVPLHHSRILRELRGRVRLAVCSNFSHSKTALDILERAELLVHFDVVVISDAVGVRKPRPEIFEAVLKELKLEPHQALHVGDSLRADVAGANSAGMRTAWITRRVADPDRAERGYEGPGPESQIADLAELPDLLDAGVPVSDWR